MRHAKFSAFDASRDDVIKGGARHHRLRHSRCHRRSAGDGRLGEMRRHANRDRVGDRAVDIAGMQQSDGGDAHGRAIGIAPQAGISRVFAAFEGVHAAAGAGSDVGRVVAVDAVVPGGQPLDGSLKGDRAGVDHGLGDGIGLLGIVGDAAGGQTGVDDVVGRGGLPVIEPAEAALGVVGVDLGWHGEGVAEGFSVEAAEDFVLETFHVGL